MTSRCGHEEFCYRSRHETNVSLMCHCLKNVSAAGNHTGPMAEGRQTTRSAPGTKLHLQLRFVRKRKKFPTRGPAHASGPSDSSHVPTRRRGWQSTIALVTCNFASEQPSKSSCSQVTRRQLDGLDRAPQEASIPPPASLSLLSLWRVPLTQVTCLHTRLRRKPLRSLEGKVCCADRDYALMVEN